MGLSPLALGVFMLSLLEYRFLKGLPRPALGDSLNNSFLKDKDRGRNMWGRKRQKGKEAAQASNLLRDKDAGLSANP